MNEIYVDKNNNLIDEDKWITSVNSIENNFDNLETNRERAKRALAAKSGPFTNRSVSVTCHKQAGVMQCRGNFLGRSDKTVCRTAE